MFSDTWQRFVWLNTLTVENDGNGKLASGNISHIRGVSFTFFYEIHVDSALATRRIGEPKLSCLQFASSAHNVASVVMETFCILVQIQYWYEW